MHFQLTFVDHTGIPDSPQSLSVVSSSTSILVRWSPPSGYHGHITQYQVVYYGTDAIIKIVNVTNGTEWRISGLKPLRRYAVKVKAFSTAGAGPFSTAMRTATTRIRKLKSQHNVFKVASKTTMKI